MQVTPRAAGPLQRLNAAGPAGVRALANIGDRGRQGSPWVSRRGDLPPQRITSARCRHNRRARIGERSGAALLHQKHVIFDRIAPLRRQGGPVRRAIRRSAHSQAQGAAAIGVECSWAIDRPSPPEPGLVSSSRRRPPGDLSRAAPGSIPDRRHRRRSAPWAGRRHQEPPRR